MLFCEARSAARLCADGYYIALDQQGTTRWNMRLVTEAEALLLQAAIQSFHTQKCLGAQVSRACALAKYSGPLAGWAALDTLETVDQVHTSQYQPFWAARAHWCRLANQPEKIKIAYRHAIGMSQSDAVRCVIICSANWTPSPEYLNIKTGYCQTGTGIPQSITCHPIPNTCRLHASNPNTLLPTAS